MKSISGKGSRKADITFWSSGRIEITARVSKNLRLSRGDVIDVVMDGDEYYLYVKFRAPVVGRHEATVFPTNKDYNYFRAYSKNLCSAVIMESGSEGCARLTIGDPVESVHGTLLPIILKMPL